MHPWEKKADTPIEKMNPSSLPLEEHIKNFNLIFERDRKYWATFGALNPGAYQFNLNVGLASGESDQSWYITVDATGARASSGQCAQARATWTSDLQTFRQAQSGPIADLSKLKLDGDVQALSQILKAFSQTKT